MSGQLPTLLQCNILVLIPKAKPGKVHGISLLESVWKLITTIIHLRLTKHIPFLKALHGFVANRGCSTAGIEAKLSMQYMFRIGQPYYQLFLDVSKAYDALDRDRTITILEDYGVGPNIICILHNFWTQHTIVPRQRGFHGKPFPAERGMTEGNILVSPTIFNIVIDAIIHSWYDRMQAAGHHTTTLCFYADDGLLADTNAASLQSGLDTIAEFLTRIGLKLNRDKTKAMITFPTPPRTNLSREAYCRRFSDDGLTYHQDRRQPVMCTICNKTLKRGYLQSHLRFVHKQIPSLDAALDILQPSSSGTLHFTFVQDKNAHIWCPVPSCPATIKGWNGLRRHFHYHHHLDTIIILPEGYLPQCPQCGLQCCQSDRHLRSALCECGHIRNHFRELQQQRHQIFSTVFTIDGKPVETVPAFKYLGRWLHFMDDDHFTVLQNIRNAQIRWHQIMHFLARHGTSRGAMGRFYVAAIHAILLYGAETWTLTNRQIKLLKTFHNHCARRIACQHIRRLPSGEWITPSTKDVLKAVKIHPIQTYIQRQRKAIRLYAEQLPIFQQCLMAPSLPTTNHHIYWWTIPDLPDQDEEVDNADNVTAPQDSPASQAFQDSVVDNSQDPQAFFTQPDQVQPPHVTLPRQFPNSTIPPASPFHTQDDFIANPTPRSLPAPFQDSQDLQDPQNDPAPIHHPFFTQASFISDTSTFNDADDNDLSCSSDSDITDDSTLSFFSSDLDNLSLSNISDLSDSELSDLKSTMDDTDPSNLRFSSSENFP